VRLLLDTCTFLWIISAPERLSVVALEAFRDPANEAMLSAVSSWEIAVKHGLGRLPLPEVPWRFVPQQREAHAITALPVSESAALRMAQLPDLHRDPFDRMLVAQALDEALTIVTPDPSIHQYPARALW
jgi:PIN domain nuclease of toxin-antitoxin system